MANINFNQDQYVDYSLQGYLKLLGVKNLNISSRTVNVGDEKVPLIHIEGYQEENARFINIDMWPRNAATEEDLAKLPEKFGDIKFRIGYYVNTDTETGERTVREGKPKWIGYTLPGKSLLEQTITLSGDKREFAE